MFKSFFARETIIAVENANVYIYYLRKLPVLGKYIPKSLYEKTNIKKIIAMITYIFRWLFELAKNILFFFVMILLPVSLASAKLSWGRGEISKQTLILYLLFCLSFIIGSVINSPMYHIDKRESMLIEFMHVDPRKCYLSSFTRNLLGDIISFSIFLLVFGFGKKTLLIIIGLIASRCIGVASTLITKNKIKTYMFLLLIPTYAILALKAEWILLINSRLELIVFIVLILLAIPSLIYILRYKNYTILAKESIEKLNSFIQRTSGGATVGVKIDEKSIKESDIYTTKYDNKEGYDYLNSIFFDRHKKLVRNALRNRVYIIGAVIGILTIIVYLSSNDLKNTIWDMMLDSPKVLLIIMYFISTSQDICRALFYNCDIYLLRYGYYREAEVITKNFSIRMKKIIVLNLLPASVISLGYVWITILMGHAKDLILIVPIIITVFVLASFFAIFNLFMYYIFQPYTTDAKVKGPMFKIINWIVYLVCYMAWQNDSMGDAIAKISIIIAILFIPISYFIIFKYSEKTFKVR